MIGQCLVCHNDLGQLVPASPLRRQRGQRRIRKGRQFLQRDRPRIQRPDVAPDGVGQIILRRVDELALALYLGAGPRRTERTRRQRIQDRALTQKTVVHLRHHGIVGDPGR